MAFQKVKSGDPIQIAASTFNTMLDATQDYVNRRMGQDSPAGTVFRDADVILVKNGSSQSVGRFGILGIDDIVIDPASVPEQFVADPALVGVTPAVPDHNSRFVVLLEPLAPGLIGRAVISGCVPVQVKYDFAGDVLKCGIVNGETGYLFGGVGAAEVIWRSEGSGVKWAIVRLGTSWTSDFVVKEEYDNYLICKQWNGSDEFGDDIPVAKPWLLRRSSYDGLIRNGITYTHVDTLTRSATDGSTTQQEQITIPYWLPETGFKGEVITAEYKLVSTGLTVSGIAVRYEDCNRAGRTWAKVVS